MTKFYIHKAPRGDKGYSMRPPQSRAEDTIYWVFIGQPIRNNYRVPVYTNTLWIFDLWFLEQAIQRAIYYVSCTRKVLVSALR